MRYSQLLTSYFYAEINSELSLIDENQREVAVNQLNIIDIEKDNICS